MTKQINKPIVPEETCTYIDMVKDIIDRMALQDDAEWRKHQAELANALLEYIRESNNKLRISGKFWYGKYKP
jgi:hypothetical protein